MAGKTHTFTADVEQLIDLVTHSIYSDKEIFLRELVSNANDALQKAKLRGSEDAAYLGDDVDLQIVIDVDTDKKIISIIDNGIGMTAAEVEKNIGTIAKSGTKEFVQNIKKLAKEKEENKPLANDLIGQFGIGFYSAFMVADKVELETKSADDKTATLWSSDGKGSYTLADSKKDTRGTVIRLYLNKESEDFADLYRVKSLVKKHSNFVPVAIMMEKEPEKTDDKDEKKADQKTDTKVEYEQINAMQSIWTKHKRDVSKEEYQEFYQELTFDREEPLDTIHVHTEGGLNYKTLLYIPKKPNPFAMMQGGDDQKEFGPQLYIQNVMIMEQCKDLLPVWLRFAKGVLETSDLDLNVSREILQNSPVMTKLQSSLVKEVLKSLARQKKKNPEAYLEFHTHYGRMLKEGVHYDMANKEKIAELVMFYSMNQDKMITLDEYIEGSTNQAGDGSTSQVVYYLPGTSIEELKHSPYVEQFVENKVDVLLMVDPIDEYVVNALQDYKGWKLKSASDADVELGDKEVLKEKKKEADKKSREAKDFLAYVQSTIGKEQLEKVALTHKLKDAVAVVSTKDGQASAQMMKIMKAMGNPVPKTPKTLELNTSHPLVDKMLGLYDADPKSEKLKNMVRYTYEQALMLEGGEIEDLTAFVKRINSLVSE